MAQEELVQCIYCGATNEPTAEACRKHVFSCTKHPTGIAVRFLRQIGLGEKDPVKLANHALFVMTGGAEGYVDARFLID